jgi:hypothetical protein
MKFSVWSGSIVVVGSLVFFFLPAIKRDTRGAAPASPASPVAH